MIIPRDELNSLLRRASYTCDYNGNNCTYSSWYSWERWVTLGIVILAAIFLMLICCCTTARRRRARGLQPYYGTAWSAYGQAPPAYNTNNINNPSYGGNTGPQQTGYASPPGVPPHPNQTSYYQPQGNYEMNNYGNSYGNNTGPVYAPPQEPPPSHIKY